MNLLRTIRRAAAPAALLALALGLGGCELDYSTAPEDVALTEQGAAGTADFVTTTLRGSLLALTDYGLGPYQPLLSGPTGCPGFTPDPFPDGDGDGVPDNTVFSFDADSCDGTGEPGTADWHGAVRVSDPGAQLGYDLDTDGLGETSDPSAAPAIFGTWWIGSRRLRGSSSSLSLGEDLELRHTFNESIDFRAAVPGSITFGELLPAGELDVYGIFTQEATHFGTVRFILMVSTLTPLAWDPACGDFVGGTFEAYRRLSRKEGAVRVTFNACGVPPTVEFIGGED